MHAAGVDFMAGTDSPNPSIVPGFSLHEELKLFVSSGFTPMEAIQAATRNPTRYLQRESDSGTIEVGKSADMVLLNANPLEDISNTQSIWAVILKGRYLNRGSLDSWRAPKPPRSDRARSPHYRRVSNSPLKQSALHRS